MPRLLGVDIPNDKATQVSLTYLFGVGPKTARELCHKCGIDGTKKARDLTDEEVGLIGSVLILLATLMLIPEIRLLARRKGYVDSPDPRV